MARRDSNPSPSPWKDLLYFLFIPAFCVFLGVEGQKYWSELQIASEGMKPFYRRVELRSRQHQRSLYIKRKTWGALGRHVIRVLSTQPNYVPFADSTREYIFAKGYPLIFQFREDTLFIFQKSEDDIYRPPQFDSPIPIVFQTVDSSYFEILNDSTQKGLRRF